MGFWVTLAVYAGVYVINRLTKPKTPDVRGTSDRDQQQPRAGDGVPLPLYYGMVQFTEPGVVWNSKPKKLNRSRVDTWGSTAHIILGIPGGVQDTGNSTERITLRRLYVNGEHLPLKVVVSGGGDEPLVTRSFLFSGDDCGVGSLARAASVAGRLFFDVGILDSPVRGAARFGQAGYDSSLLPAFRFQTRVFLTSPAGDVADSSEAAATHSGFRWGLDPTFPALRFEVWNPCVIDHGFPYLPWQNNNSAEANPIAVIYDLLTNSWARVGLPASKIDLDSFNEAALTVGVEKNGYSRIINDPADAADVIREILTQINGVMYEDPQSRKLRIKLVRQDYVAASLPLFDETNVAEVVQLNTSTWSETYNEVRVNFTDRRNKFTKRTAVAQDQANITSQGGRVRAVTFEYPGVSTHEIASQIASRELGELSIPKAVVKLRVNRDAFDLRPGDPFRFSWADYGIAEAVFRVQHLDLGAPGEEGIVVDAIQDSFFLGNVFGGDEEVPFPPAARMPIERRVFTEAPRYLISRAISQDYTSDANTQRALYLAGQPQVDSASFTAIIRDDDAVREESDLSNGEAYLDTAVLNFAYGRELDPYDTSIGLFIRDVSDVSVLRSSSALEIRRQGNNLIYVGTAEAGEFMSYESFTSLGSGVYQLTRVWRGLLDTPAIRHAAGANVYFLSDALGFNSGRYVGRFMDLPRGRSANGTMLPIVGGQSMDEADFGVEVDRFVSRERTNLPYPPADLTANGSKAPSITVEGLTATCRARSRTNMMIVRGDAASESPLPDTTLYVTRTQKVGPVNFEGPEVFIDTRFDTESHVTATQSGHGTIELGVASVSLELANELGDGTQAQSWSAPKVAVSCPPWRNLLANADFAQPLNYYAVTDSDGASWAHGADGAVRVDDSFSLGGDGFYLTTSESLGGVVDVAQTVRVDGYFPNRMQAVLDFYERAIVADPVDDAIQVDLQALSSTDVVVASATFGPTAGSSQWTRRTLEIANLPSTAVKLRVRVQMTSTDEPPFANVAFSDPVLRLGQSTAQLVSNGGFNVDMTGWSTAAGAFVRDTVFPFSGAGYTRGSNTASINEIFQDCAVPTGFAFGTAVLTFAQWDGDLIADGDTGQVILEARDGGGVVLASNSTTAVEVSSSWQRKLLVLDNLPVGTVTLRVRLRAIRAGGSGIAGAAFDDLDLRVHKHLDPDTRINVDFTTPAHQPLPRTVGEWVEAFPSTFPPPDYGLFNGELSLVGALGIEPAMRWDTPREGAVFRGCYDAERDSVDSNCYEFRAFDASGIIALDDLTTYGNFSSAGSFTAMVVFRNRAFTARAADLVGRHGTTGWKLSIDSGGTVSATLTGSGGATTVLNGMDVHDGAPHFAAIVYDQPSQTLSVVDDSGSFDVSIAAVGDFACDEDVPFSIGRVLSDSFDGQIARVYLWRIPLGPSELATFWKHGDAPAGTTLTANARTGALVVVGPSDARGQTLISHHQTQVPYAHSGEWHVAQNVAMTNLIPTPDFYSADWTGTADFGVVDFTDESVSPLGFMDAMRIEGNNTVWLESPLFTLGAGATVLTRFAIRAGAPSGTHDVRVQLVNSAGVVKGQFDLTQPVTWAVGSLTFTTWDASTAQARLRFLASATGSSEVAYIGGPVFVWQSSVVPVGVPYATALTDSSLSFGVTPGVQFNHEGEVYAEGLALQGGPGVLRDIAIVDDGSGLTDRRHLRMTASNEPQFLHYDGAGAAATATNAATLLWSSPFSIRGRWNRAPLIEMANTRSGVRFDTGPVAAGRVADWTPGTAPLTRLRVMPSNMLIRRVVLFGREPNLGQTF